MPRSTERGDARADTSGSLSGGRVLKSRALAAGEQPTVLYTPEDPPPRHFLGEVAFGYGLLITPTCDMPEQREGGIAHPYRTVGQTLASLYEPDHDLEQGRSQGFADDR